MKHYSKEFKEEALKLSDEIGVKKAAQQLGIALSLCQKPDSRVPQCAQYRFPAKSVLLYELCATLRRCSFSFLRCSTIAIASSYMDSSTICSSGINPDVFSFAII